MITETKIFKEKYNRADMDVIRFIAADVLMTSNPDDEYEGDNPYGSGSVHIPLI